MQQQQTTLSIWCERLIEAGWLVILALIPIYFNLLSSRHFEPDKATTLRAIVLVMATLLVIQILERMSNAPSQPEPQSGSSSEKVTSSNPFGAIWEYLSSIPLAIPVLLYTLVFIIATIASVVPEISLWGSYQRLQGTYTNLSYIALFVIMVATVRRHDQVERIITVILLTAIAVSMYGVIQHMQQDPLPWKSDNLAERVASTMGNAIFVAAYLIMVMPLALYRLFNGINEARHTPAAPHANLLVDLLWALAYILMVLGTMAGILAAITFGAAVQSADFSYWWVFPGVIVASTALWALPSLRIDTDEHTVPIWPGGLFFAHALFWGFSFTANQSNLQILPDRTTLGQEWWVWLLLGMAAIVAFYVLALLLPRRSGHPSPLTMWLRVGGTLFITGLILLATVYTQSRGPLLGLASGLFTFFFLLLWQAMRRARQMGATTTARWMGVALWGWGGLTVMALSFLIVFNLSDAPFFNRLREQPYIGRFGTLLETRYGTGRVRFLIWNGDEHAGGARELITTDPVRTVVGWGPESMFVAFNPFYPPSLAEVESRGASPDRSHQSILDEMVTKGLLGLISYFFLIISFFGLAWRMMRQSSEWHWQVFFIACMSIVVSHLVEGLTGIPIVSTLTMLWVAMAATVSGGMLAGHYTLGRVLNHTTAAPPEENTRETSSAADEEGGSDSTTDDAKPAPSAGGKSGKKKNKQRGTTTRTSVRSGGNGGRSVAARGGASAIRTGANRVGSRGAPGRRQTSPAALILYAVLIVLTLGATWQLNLRTVYADMLFHMGQSYSGQPNANLNTQVRAMDYFLQTVRNDRSEDFYYLNLGRSLMQIAAIQRQANIPMGTAEAEVESSEQERSEQINRLVNELLLLPDVQAVSSFVQAHNPSELMTYAEAVLERAYELNPLNKDHYANLGRLNNFWYSWTQDITHLQDSVAWYHRANEVAPQDVVLLNESARATLSLGRIAERSNDQTSAQGYYDHAEYLLERAQTLDPGYTEYLEPLADLRRIQDDKAAATELYARQIEIDPQALDATLDATIDWLSDSPELLSKLSSAYMEQAHAAEEALTSENPDVIEKYKDIDSAALYAQAGRLAVHAENGDMASQAYAQAVMLKPENLEYRLNYTISLSDTRSYNEALQQAQEGLALAENQADSEKVVQFDQIISIVENSAAGGQ